MSPQRAASLAVLLLSAGGAGEQTRPRWLARDRSTRMRQLRTPTGSVQRLRDFAIAKAEGLLLRLVNFQVPLSAK